MYPNLHYLPLVIMTFILRIVTDKKALREKWQEIRGVCDVTMSLSADDLLRPSKLVMSGKLVY